MNVHEAQLHSASARMLEILGTVIYPLKKRRKKVM